MEEEQVWLSEATYLKATPNTEGDDRFIYFEPSTEDTDSEGDRIRQEALAASAQYYLKFGNVDIDHISVIGPKMGMDRAEAKLYEVGYPVEVRTSPRVLVKAAIYRGEGEQCRMANQLWDSLTKQSPPKRYYPSVAGKTLSKVCDDDGCEITRVAWNNTALASQPAVPVNRAVKAISVVSFDEFLKAVTAGHTTNATQLSGGEALRKQSIEPEIAATVQGPDNLALPKIVNYLKSVMHFWKTGEAKCEHVGDLSRSGMHRHFTQCDGCDPASASEAAEQLLKTISERLYGEALVARHL